MAIIPQEFLDAVVAIGVDDASTSDGKFWIGSGFIVSRKEQDKPGKATFYIVTKNMC
ncbi:MAG: hypothetical protein J6A79_07080 [Clostridia bacterium]|nr:hypothetical protein [Clostridia bacterium]